MKAHYAGSIAYDNEHDELEDSLFMAFSFEDLFKEMKDQKQHMQILRGRHNHHNK